MKDDIIRGIDFLWENHRGSVLGVTLGIIIAVCILIFGFWNMVFILAFASAGLWLGREMESGNGTWLEDMKNVKLREIVHRKNQGYGGR